MPDDPLARDVWLRMTDLVTDHGRRRDVADATGVSFGKTRALRRLAGRPMTMGQLAEAIDIERPNATVLVDELEADGLVRRKPHPTDRRAKLVEVTRKGRALARRADTILATPPPSLAARPAEELRALLATLEAVVEGRD